MLTDDLQLLCGDAETQLRTLPDNSINCIVTSIPYYGLRDYGTGRWEGGRAECKHVREKRGTQSTIDGGAYQSREVQRGTCKLCGAQRVDEQIGLEETPDQYVARITAVFAVARQKLAPDGTLWLNVGDSYAHSTANTDSFRRKREEVGQGVVKKHGVKTRDLIGIPWMIAFALRAEGWYLRSEIIWEKPNPMPESVRNRPTNAHEKVFLLTKSRRYHYDADAIAEPLAETSVARLAQDVAQQAGSTRGHGGTRTMKAVGGGRIQLQRAHELAREKGLTQAHIDAIRACGITDTGKARQTQTGAGQNSEQVQQLAAEAKQALGGYYREFLTGKSASGNLERKPCPDAPDTHDGAAAGNIPWTDTSGTRNARNARNVWRIATQPYAEAHFAVMPPALARRCILAGSRVGDVVCDPFNGSGTTGQEALLHGRRYIGIDLNPDYLKLTGKRLSKIQFRILA